MVVPMMMVVVVMHAAVDPPLMVAPLPLKRMETILLWLYGARFSTGISTRGCH
jgi:hypothetical protein